MSDYFQLPAISNSDLTIVSHLLKGIPYRPPISAFSLGSAFHELLLEPEKFQIESQQLEDLELLYHMYHTVSTNAYCQDILDRGAKEQVVLWQESTTSLDCKCKLDIWQEGLVADIKTTSATTLRSFLNYCYHYEYDRQMAFYADSVNARQVCLIGVSKKARRLFFVHKSAKGKFIAEGRRKYQYLLQKVKELDLFEHVWYERSSNIV